MTQTHQMCYLLNKGIPVSMDLLYPEIRLMTHQMCYLLNKGIPVSMDFSKHCWVSWKQRKPWWNNIIRGIRSASKLFWQAFLSPPPPHTPPPKKKKKKTGVVTLIAYINQGKLHFIHICKSPNTGNTGILYESLQVKAGFINVRPF